MIIYRYKKIKVTIWTPFASGFSFSWQSNSCSIIDTFWYFYCYIFVALNFSVSTTISTRFTYSLSVTATLRTCLLYSKKTLISSYFAFSFTIITRVRFRALCRAITWAAGTFFIGCIFFVWLSQTLAINGKQFAIIVMGLILVISTRFFPDGIILMLKNKLIEKVKWLQS